MGSGPQVPPKGQSLGELLEKYIDWVPPSLPPHSKLAKLKICEDNDAVLKLLIKQRNPRLRHVVRTHRVNADFIFKVVHDDDCISARYVNTKVQIADMMTKASFTNEQWKHLCSLAQIGPVDKKLHKLVPAKETTNHARVCCLQSRMTAPGCKGTTPQARAYGYSSDFSMSIPLTSDVRPTPASNYQLYFGSARDVTEPQPTEGGGALKPEVEKSDPQLQTKLASQKWRARAHLK